MTKKLIIIIGAGTGISYSVAKRFGSEGYKIALIARSEEKLKKLVDSLNQDRIYAVYGIADVANTESLKTTLGQISNKEGHADMILYNAAGVSVKDLLEQDWETMKQTFDVSVGGAFHLLQTVLPYCINENKGKLFFTGGGFAMEGDPQWTSLSLGKAGLRNLIQAAQKKVKGTNIHIAHLMICGFVRPDDKKYNPDAIAEQYWKLFNQRPGEFENEIIY